MVMMIMMMMLFCSDFGVVLFWQ